LCLAVTLLCRSAPAQEDHPDDKLKAVEKALEESRKNQARYSKEAGILAADLARLRDASVAAAQTVQLHEAAIADIEEQLGQLAIDEDAKLAALQARAQQYDEFLMALQRLARNPPEALALAPGEPVDAVRSALLLSAAIPQIEAKGHIGLRAYVKSSSQVWHDSGDSFELMTVADVLWPSLLYLRLHPSPSFEHECNALLADLPGFYRSDTHSISNDFTSRQDERTDSWYPFENALIKYPMIGSLVGSKEITDHFLDAFRTAQKMAQQYDYLFPIYYRVATLQAEGAGTNYAVNGLYAWAAILANKLTGQDQYLEEARRAIHVLYTVPAERLFHEPQELAYGALAAAELGMAEAAKYLLYEQLRMFYWYSDPSQKFHDIRGMVQAAASILYPAFKENVEAIVPWTGVMKRGIVFEGLLRFMDQQRRNNFYFFEDCSTSRKRDPSAFIPYENLGTLELAGMTGNVGKEIYGAGESIWMYLMFEALGQVSDRELMLVNLDLLDAVHLKEFPPQKLSFILYNPTSVARSANISFPAAKKRIARLTVNGKASEAILQVPRQSFIQLIAEF